MVPRRLWHVLTNVRQVLEHDMRTIVFDGFSHNFVGNSMQVYLEASVPLALDACYCVMCRPCPALLEVATSLLVLPLPVVKFVCRPEPAGRSDRELVYTEVHTEDCSVPGGGVGVVVFFEHRRVEIPVAVA